MASTDHFSALAVELQVKTFKQMPVRDIFRARRVSKNIKAVIDNNDNAIFKHIIQCERRRIAEPADGLKKVSALLLADALEWFVSSRGAWNSHNLEETLECFVSHYYDEKYACIWGQRGWHELNGVATSFVFGKHSGEELGLRMNSFAMDVGDEGLIEDAESLRRLDGTKRCVIIDDPPYAFTSTVTSTPFLTQRMLEALRLPELPVTPRFHYDISTERLYKRLEMASCLQDGEIDMNLTAAALDEIYIY
jgi:hypothetical protein